jgi:hypothetical protein
MFKKISLKVSSITNEIVSDFYGQKSAGRIGLFISLAFSVAIAVTGLILIAVIKEGTPDKTQFSQFKIMQISSYCSNMVLMFLGSAFTFYGASKTAETFTQKWAPNIASSVLKNKELAEALKATAELNADTQTTTQAAPTPAPKQAPAPTPKSVVQPPVSKILSEDKEIVSNDSESN